MRTEEIRPTGINRAYAEQDAASSACEELINMRLENGALRPTGEKVLALQPNTGQPEMLQIYIHRIAGGQNYIGVYISSTNTIVCVLSENNGKYTPTTTLLTIADDSADVDIKFIGNLMVVRSGADKKIYNFSYHNGGYTAIPDILPDILLDVTKENVAAKTGSTTATSDYTSEELFGKYEDMSNITAKDYLQDINAGLSYLRRSAGRYESEGFVGICANLRLYDGTETKPTAPRWFYIGGMPEIIYGNLEGNNEQRALHINMSRGKLTVNINEITVDGAAWSSTLYNKYKDYIAGINIYCTYPKSLVDIEKTITGQQESVVERYVGKWIETLKKSSSAVVEARITPTTISATYEYLGNNLTVSQDFTYEYNNVVDLGGELFYKQQFIELKDDLLDMQEDVDLDFSDAMLTGDTMSVENSGYINRYGQMEVYNKRLHLFDTTNELEMPQDDYFSQAMSCDADTPVGLTAFDVDVKVVAYSKTDTEDLISMRSFQTKGYGTRTGTVKYAWTNDVDNVYTVASSPSANDDYYIYDSSDGTFTIGGQVDSITTPGETIHIEDTDYYRNPSNDKMDYDDDGTLQYVALRSVSAIIDSRTYRMDIYVKYGSSYFKIPVNLVKSSAYNYSMLAARKDKFFMFIHDIVPQNNTPESFEYALLDVTDRESSQAEWDSITSSIEKAIYNETDIVVVSKNNNPTFFPPQNSYRIPGNIIGIAVNAQGISDVQIGQWPMDVFTDNGVYALEQGTGEVLYSNVVKIADDIASTGGMISTPYGIAFLQGDGVYLLNGRRSQRISVGLDGFVDLDIRRCQQYKNAHGSYTETLFYCWSRITGLEDQYYYTDSDAPEVGDTVYDDGGHATHYIVVEYDDDQQHPSITIREAEDETAPEYLYERWYNGDIEQTVTPIYDIFPYLLGERQPVSTGELIPLSFRDQMREPENILIGYDNNREELWISDIRESFSYVYSFPERSWHTVTTAFEWFNGPYAISEGKMYNLNVESHDTSVVRHIQSRPLKLGSDGYKCIERMIARINANGPLENSPNNHNLFSMYVFGSRDLRNWYMIGLNQFEGYTQSLQINKTSSKFRAFIITAGGNLTKGSEFSSVQTMIQDFYNTKLR